MTLGRLPGLLVEGGFSVTVMGNPAAPAARSWRTKQVVPVDGGADRLLEAALALVRRDPEAWKLVLPGEDTLLMEMKRLGADHVRAPLLPVRPEAIGVLVSKIGFSVLADAIGLPVPRWSAVESLDEALAAAERIGYPVIVKPDEGQAGNDLFRAKSPEDLRTRWGNRSARQIVQEFVPGRAGLLELLYDHGRLVCWVGSCKVRTLLGPFGMSTCRQFVDLPGVREHLVELGRATGFHGFCGLDLIQRETGGVCYVEFNTRPTSGYEAARVAGVGFADALRALGEGTSAEFPPPAFDGAEPVVPFFPEDIVGAAYSASWPAFFSRCFCPALLRTVPWTDGGLMRTNAGRVYQALRARQQNGRTKE
ncbi:MAG: hypothetical protein PWP23_3031 [Candidatus Sumerlaeota bacterium]|nr:hypothetical protein [Candidatus Sumerlaeota bacterium]